MCCSELCRKGNFVALCDRFGFKKQNKKKSNKTKQKQKNKKIKKTILFNSSTSAYLKP